jgi:hypothetical protein
MRPRPRAVIADPGEQAFLARDAYGSVTVLALLLLIWGVVSLAAVRALPFWPFGAARVVLTTVAAVALLYFARTWKRPSLRIAFRFSLAAIAISLVLVAWTSWGFSVRGRLFEAFPTTNIAMVSMALVAPGSFWIGVLLVALFQAELLGVILFSRHLGIELLLPNGAPLSSFAFASLSIGLLVLREQRRRRALRHLRIQSETKALRELSPLFDSLRTEIDRQLTALSEALRRLRGERDPRSQAAMNGAVERVGGLSARLQQLRGEERDETGAERRFTARDAHDSATLNAAIVTLMFLFYALVMHRRGLPHGALLSVVAAVPPLIILGYLVARRRLPSERVALIVIVFFYAFSLPFVTWGQVQIFALHVRLFPLAAHEVMMVTVSLVVATRLRVAIGLVLLTGGTALALYFFLHMGAHPEIVPYSEPWAMLVFLVLSVGLVMMREQRRIASVRLFRAEWELVALHRQAALFVALRDRLGSPLQSLVLYTAQLERTHPPESIAPIQASVERLVALSRQLAKLENDFVASGMQRLSMDAERALRRQD